MEQNKKINIEVEPGKFITVQSGYKWSVEHKNFSKKERSAIAKYFKKQLEQYLRGRVFWDSRNLGTYRKTTTNRF